MTYDATRFRLDPLRIGNVVVSPPLVLAPMAGVTDQTYRQLMAEYGAGMVMTEMISAQGLVLNQPGSWALCAQDPALSIPVAVQIFGADPSTMARAAKLLEQQGAALVDINAGCPVRKVARQGAGASLLKNPDRLASVVDAVRNAVAIPVTVKIRAGWDDASARIAETAQRLSSAGADAISVHGRTAVQFFEGRADWSWIRNAKEAVDIPVIGNGDVSGPFSATQLVTETGCDAVMVGRATLGNPWILAAIASSWGYPVKSHISPDWGDFCETVRWHVLTFSQKRPKSSGQLKKILFWYSKGCPGSARLRARISELDRHDDLLTLLDIWVQELKTGSVPFLSAKIPEMGNLQNGREGPSMSRAEN